MRNFMAKPILLVTRKLPEAVEARAARDYDARLNLDDAQGTSDDIVRRACEVGASLRAAGLNVFDGEPNVDPGYRTLENVALLPHIGSATVESRLAMGHKALDNLDAVLVKRAAPPDRVV
jgi:hypothetical protein